MNSQAKAGTTPIPPEKRELALVSKAKPVRMNLKLALHMVLVVFPYAFAILPLKIIISHIILRFRSKMVHLIGRPWTNAYSIAYAGIPFIGYKDWVTKISEGGVTGRWIAPPGTKRSEDEVVLYFIHGGGFLLDTAGNAQNYFLYLAKELNLRRKVQFSVFQLDYELAPEFAWPSQLIETQAGYHYLVNKCGVSASRIVVSGDSAGGNLATSWLLHLARPCPQIKVPESLGPTPPRPGGAILISPFVDLVSYRPSRKANAKFDFIENGGAFHCALDYVGVPEAAPVGVPSWNPIHFFQFPNSHPPRSLLKANVKFEAGKELKGLDLFKSPYVNPIVCEDLDWIKEAFPGDGMTMVTWGGKEIFSDDIEEWFKRMKKAGCEPTKLYKALGAHDWVLYDSFIPGLHKTHTFGPDRVATHNISVVANFLQAVDIRHREERFAKLSSAKKSETEELSKPEPEQKHQVAPPAEQVQAKGPSAAKGTTKKGGNQGKTKEKNLEGSGVMVGKEWKNDE